MYRVCLFHVLWHHHSFNESDGNVLYNAFFSYFFFLIFTGLNNYDFKVIMC